MPDDVNGPRYLTVPSPRPILRPEVIRKDVPPEWLSSVVFTARRHPVLAGLALLWFVIFFANQTLELLVNLRIVTP